MKKCDSITTVVIFNHRSYFITVHCHHYAALGRGLPWWFSDVSRTVS